MNYIVKGKSITVEAVRAELIKRYNSEYNTAEKVKINKEIKEYLYIPKDNTEKEAFNKAFEQDIMEASNNLVLLNEMLLNDKAVYLKCEKEPRGNLDTGKHYYSIFVVKNEELYKIWLRAFIVLVGGCINNKDRNMSKYIFDSGAIGMSRALDATDNIFNLLKSLGGCYAQITRFI